MCGPRSGPFRFNGLGGGCIADIGAAAALLVAAVLVAVCAGRRRRCGGEGSWGGAGSLRLDLGGVSWGGCGGMRPKFEVHGSWAVAGGDPVACVAGVVGEVLLGA